MSDELTALSIMISHLTPVHEIAERGLSERTAERLFELLLDLERHLSDLEARLEGAEAAAEAEQEQAERKPPL